VDSAISITGVEKYQIEEVEPEGEAENQLQGLDEAEANLGDSEEPDRDEEEEEEKKEEEEKSELEYWVQCEKCQKWRKLPTPWGPDEDFDCDRILVRCAQPCDVCKTSRCSLLCSPD
jgi:hypothetical protein